LQLIFLINLKVYPRWMCLVTGMEVAVDGMFASAASVYKYLNLF